MKFTCADATNLFAIHEDPVVMQWFGVDPMPDLAAAQQASALSWAFEHTDLHRIEAIVLRNEFHPAG